MDTLAGVAIGAGAVALIWLAVHLTTANRKLVAQVVELERREQTMVQRVQTLEATARTRMPHEAKAELLNALSVIEHTLDERHIDEVFLSNIAGHINNAIEVGSTAQGRKA